MSSLYVRNQFKNYIAANIGSEPLLDLSGEYREIRDLLSDNGLANGDPFTCVEFIAGQETPITLGSVGAQGTKFREHGGVHIMIVGAAKPGGSDAIMTRADALYNKLRNMKLGTAWVESMTTPRFEEGGEFNFVQGLVSAIFMVSYFNDFDL